LNVNDFKFIFAIGGAHHNHSANGFAPHGAGEARDPADVAFGRRKLGFAPNALRVLLLAIHVVKRHTRVT